MKIIVNGACGRMGSEVIRMIGERDDLQVVAAVDQRAEQDGFYTSLEAFTGPADLLIDFSHHTAASSIVEYILNRKLPAIIATTGHTPEEAALIQSAAKSVPVFFSANMSLGVALLVQLAAKTAAVLKGADIEIVETHHNRKADAPSGTALMIANAMRDARGGAEYCFGRHGMQKRNPGEIGIHAVRMGNIPGIHEVLVSTDTQTITLKHEAHDRALFAEGALAAAEFIIGRPAGLYDMQSMVQ